MLLLDAIYQHASCKPNAPAFKGDEGTLSFAQLAQDVEQLASQFPRTTNPNQGPVLLLGGNTLWQVRHFYALLYCGYGVLPLSPRLPLAEISRLAKRANAKFALTLDSNIKLPSHIQRLANTPNTTSNPKPTNHGWLCLPSSGTTGLPKLVRRNLDSLNAVALQVSNALSLTAEDTVLATIPLSHSYGIEIGLLAPLIAGSSVVLDNAFDPSQLAERVIKSHCTVLPTVPVMVDMLVHMRPQTLDTKPPFPLLRRICCAGAPLPTTLWQQAKRELGIGIDAYYGATEIGSVCHGDGQQDNFDPTSAGKPMRGVSLQIVASDKNGPTQPITPLPHGETGELIVSAPSMMTEYLDTTAEGKPFQWQGKLWFATGDLGTLDENHSLRLTGRRKLLIEIGGSKVNPLEVESILCQHPDVSEALVLPDRVSDTVCRLRALIIPTNGEKANTREIKAHCKTHLAAYKVPRSFELHADLKRTPTGKILRGEYLNADLI